MSELGAKVKSVLQTILPQITKIAGEFVSKMESASFVKQSAKVFECELTDALSKVENLRDQTPDPEPSITDDLENKGKNEQNRQAQLGTLSSSSKTNIVDSFQQNKSSIQFEDEQGPIPLEKMCLDTEDETVYWIGRAFKCGSAILEEMSKKLKILFDYHYTEIVYREDNDTRR